MMFPACALTPQPTGIAPVDWLLETRVDVWPYDLWTSMRKARGRPLTPPSPARFSGPGYGCMTNGTKCCFTATSTCHKCPADAVNPSGLWGCGVSVEDGLNRYTDGVV